MNNNNKNQLNIPRLYDVTPRLGNRFSAWLGRSVLGLLGWKFEGRFPDSPKMVAAVAPHTSNWDFIIAIAASLAMRLKISYLGKDSIFVPPFKGLLLKLGGIPVERSRSHGVVEQLVKRFEQSQQLVLGIAPEGTRSKVDHWKTGFLQIANQANVPLLLIYLDFERKVIGFGPLLDVSDDLELEMQRVRDFYARIHPRHPHLA